MERGNAKGNAIGRRILTVMNEAVRLPFAFTSDGLATCKVRRACEPYGHTVWNMAAHATQKFTVYRIHRQRAAYQKLLQQNPAGYIGHVREVVEAMSSAQPGRNAGPDRPCG